MSGKCPTELLRNMGLADLLKPTGQAVMGATNMLSYPSFQPESLSMKRIRVLFLCATNGVQSPMAEALLNRLGSEHFEVTSAGMDCGEMHPLTVEVMRGIGID